jgi:L-arabinose isomerase
VISFIISSIKTPPFFAACKLMAEGIGYAAEGDVSAAAGSVILNALCGCATLSEIFTMDFESEAFVMSHMAEVNIGMARQDQPIRIVAKDFSWASKAAMSPLTPAVSLQPGTATLLSIVSRGDGTFRYVAIEGQIDNFKHLGKIDSPVFKFKPNCPLAECLKRYSMVGGTHHQSLTYGKRAKEIAALGRLMGIEAIIL